MDKHSRASVRKRWWQKPIPEGRITRAHLFVAMLAIGALVEILSSPVTRIWLGLTIIGSLGIAAFLMHRRDADDSELRRP
jgi:fatty acid desaturase